MYFSEIVIENYKCFRLPTKLRLEKGINIIVGQNNVGKTSILEALELRFDRNLHQSYETYERNKRLKKNRSKVTVVFNLSREELIDILISAQGSNHRNHKFPLSTNPDLDRIRQDNLWKKSREVLAKDEVEKYFSNDRFTFRLFNDYPDDQYDNWHIPEDAYIEPKINKATANDGETEFNVEFTIDSPDAFSFSEINQSNTGKERISREDFVRSLGQPLRRYIYRFRAERVPFEACPLGTNKILSPRASNLAEVLSLLNPNQLRRFNELVNEIFPNIHQVDVLKLDEDHNGQVAYFAPR